jgi:hypothetical protein
VTDTITCTPVAITLVATLDTRRDRWSVAATMERFQGTGEGAYLAEAQANALRTLADTISPKKTPS